MTRLFDVARVHPRRTWRSLPLSVLLHGAGGALLLSLQVLAPLELPEPQLSGALVFRPPAPAVAHAASLPASAIRRPAAAPVARRDPAPVIAQPATQAAPSVIPDGLPALDAVDADGALADLPFGPGCTGPGCVAGLTGSGGPAGSIGAGEGGGHDPAQPLVAGREVTPPLKLHDVRPDYPDLALRARVQGRVELTCTIAADGRVADARVLSGPPLLRDAALQAVLQWRYRPTRLDGVPVPVLLNVTVHFRLGR